MRSVEVGGRVGVVVCAVLEEDETVTENSFHIAVRERERALSLIIVERKERQWIYFIHIILTFVMNALRDIKMSFFLKPTAFAGFTINFII